MNVRCITTITDALLLEPAWRQLTAPHPFLTWDWLSCWWDHFLADGQLLILVGTDERDRVVGIAPFWIQASPLRGRVVQFLGSGKACSDHMSMLTATGQEAAFATACGAWLGQANESARPTHHWDYIQWIGCDAADPAMHQLTTTLSAQGHQVTRSPGQPCYFLDLSAGWPAYLQSRSNSTRRLIKRLESQLGEPVVEVHVYTTADELAEHWDTFKRLHQLRHCRGNDTGCFGHRGFEDFLRDATLRLAAHSAVQLVIVTVDGVAVSAAYNFELAGRLFNYQSGMDPAYADLRPGFLALVAVLRDIDRRQLDGLDLLRGDEPYKARWRASCVETTEIRIPCRRTSSRLLHELWKTSNSVKHALRVGAAVANGT